MKTRFPFFCFGLASLSATAILLTRIAGSAAPPPEKPEKVLARTRTFDSMGTNPVPTSVFNVPTNKVAGRDPFFPDCNCGVKMVVKIDTGESKTPSLGLSLQGLSGTTEKPLAIINGRTFEKGETQELPNGTGPRIPLRCVDIRENSVIIEIGGKQQELFLHSK